MEEAKQVEKKIKICLVLMFLNHFGKQYNQDQEMMMGL